MDGIGGLGCSCFGVWSFGSGGTTGRLVNYMGLSRGFTLSKNAW